VLIKELIKNAQNGDKKSLDIIVSENSGLIWSVVRKFQNRGYEFDDLFQIGAIGLIKSVKNFDLSYDVKFSTYAVPMIMGEIKRFLRDDGIIKVSRHIKELSQRVRCATEILETDLNRAPKISEIASYLNESAEDVSLAIDSATAPESLYKSVGENDNTYLLDKLSNKNDEEELINTITLKNAITSLSDRDKKIILLRYFKGRTQTEIAKLLGISQVQVSRLEKKILSSMKKMIS